MSFTFKNSVNKPVTARLETDRYINDNLAILVFETEPDEYDDGYYCDLTTNFGEVLESPDMFYLDTNKAPADLINVLEKDGLFTYTGRIRSSGFCNYPICQLTEKGKTLLKGKALLEL